MRRETVVQLQAAAFALVVGSVVIVPQALVPARAQTQAETDQLRAIAQGGVELLKRTPVTGTAEAQTLLNVSAVLDAIAHGALVVSRPEPPPKLQGGPAPEPEKK